MVVSKAVTEVLNDLSQVEEKKGNEYPRDRKRGEFKVGAGGERE